MLSSGVLMKHLDFEIFLFCFCYFYSRLAPITNFMERSNVVKRLTTEAVQSAALALKSVHHIKSGHGLSAGVLGVGDGITDDVLKEHLEDTTGLLVDETRDALHTTTTSETADSRLGDTLDVITQDLSVALGTALSETLSSLSTSRHL